MKELKALYKVKDSNLPFVIFSNFGTNKVKVIIQNNNNLNFLEDFDEDKGFVFSPFEKNLRKILIKEDVSFEIFLDNSFKRKVISINDFFINKNLVNTSDILEKDKVHYRDKFNLAKQNIEEGILKKVVISRREAIFLKDKFDLIDTYINLVLKNSKAFNYLFFHPKIGIWLGSSPELFLLQEDFLIKTNSLAGTKLKEENWTNKEKEEQNFVSDYILEIFKKEGLKTEISEIETFSYANIDHLKNTIIAELKEETDINEIIKELHPTPAVCGFPKRESYNFIISKDGYDREFYTGFLGYTSKDRKELYVNLRCMKFDLEKAYLYVGGGITKDSILEKEWAETELKIKLLKSLLE